jgi:hypothetical protein
MLRSGAVFRARTLVVALVCLPLVGCSAGRNADVPQTYPVRGKVINKEDGKPLADAAVHFEAIDTPGGAIAVVGTTGPDGRFVISTIRDNAKVPGAPEGSYRIRVSPRMGEDQRDNSVLLPGPYKVESKDANEFDLTFPPPAPPEGQ